MVTLKPGIKNISSKEFQQIVQKYSHKDKIRLAFYYAKDCAVDAKEIQDCLNLSVESSRKEIKRVVIAARTAANKSKFHHSFNAAACAAKTLEEHYFVHHAYWNATQVTQKYEEYKQVARFYSYEDLNYPFKEKFNLDDDTELKIFLDFLEDNYPEALIYSREDFLSKRMCREYLRAVYQGD